MALKILASAPTPAGQAQQRGKLFEKLMAEVLRHFGYQIDAIPSVNYAGMEIDIDGRAIATGVPIYAECKFYDSEVDSPKLQAFVGKYMTRWRKDSRCQGLFLAVPGVNSHAKGFYKENFQDATDMTIRLIEEDAVADAIHGSRLVCSPDRVGSLVSVEFGKVGDRTLAYTDKGFFWIQYIIPPGAAIAKAVAIFDGDGRWISDETTLEYLRSLQPDLGNFDWVYPIHDTPQSSPKQASDTEEIVEVRGSSSCFEYQFPASPEFFVGRADVFRELDRLVADVNAKVTSARGILFEANSGLGKSSVVLSCVARLNDAGHFAVSIDCRSASSSLFVMQVTKHVLDKFGDFGGLFSCRDDLDISGTESAARRLIEIGRALAVGGRFLFVFFDQFENLFFLPDALRPIRDLFLKVCDAESHVVLGFSWKTDLFGLTTDFPYVTRDAIASSSRRIALDPFSEAETSDLLHRLGQEIRARLRKDLTFFLSEFSQGYPWLLKKLCAHVKQQREAGVAQADIANSLLNVDQLFEDDLRVLSPQQEDALRRIAKAAPVAVSELGDDLTPEILQSLVNGRLVVRVGSKIDVYWDIFRDYLNSGRVPIQDNYILRIPVSGVLKAIRLLVDLGSNADASVFRERAGISEKSFYNIMKDLRLLGLGRLEGGAVLATIPGLDSSVPFEPTIRGYLKDRLRRNRLVWKIVERLDAELNISLDDVARLLAESCPYVSAESATWKTYARVFADWMDFADLALLDAKDGRLVRYHPGSEVRQRTLGVFRGRTSSGPVLLIQFSPVAEVCSRIADALKTGGRLNWTGLKPSTVSKSLATLEDLGFIIRKTGAFTITDKMRQLVSHPERRTSIFSEAALQVQSFSTFVSILNSHKESGWTLLNLGRELDRRLGHSNQWKDGTAVTMAKILLDWARHTELAPGDFAEVRRGSRRVPAAKPETNPTLF